jgi:hypothetical protein
VSSARSKPAQATQKADDANGMYMLDLDENAAHRATLVTKAQFQQNHRQSAIAQLEGFDCFRIWPDLLHIVDLGLGADAVASAMGPGFICSIITVPI